MGDSLGSEMLPENAWAVVPMGHIWKSQPFLLGQKHQLISRDVLFVLLCKFLAPDGLERKKKPKNMFPAHKTFVLIKQQGICFTSPQVWFLGFYQAFCTQISTSLVNMESTTKLGRFFLSKLVGYRLNIRDVFPPPSPISCSSRSPPLPLPEGGSSIFRV